MHHIINTSFFTLSRRWAFYKAFESTSMHCKNSGTSGFHLCSSNQLLLYFQSWAPCLSGGKRRFKLLLQKVSIVSHIFLAIRSAEIHREDTEQKCEAVSAWLRYFLNDSHMFSWYSGKERQFKQDEAKVSQPWKNGGEVAFLWNQVRSVTVVIFFLIICLFWG